MNTPKVTLTVEFTPEELGMLRGLLKGIREVEEIKTALPIFRTMMENMLSALEQRLDAAE